MVKYNNDDKYTMKQNVSRMLRCPEWRDVQRVTEIECVWSVEAGIFHLRHWPIKVSPNSCGPMPNYLFKLSSLLAKPMFTFG